jgi:hypothetical protein
MIPHISLAWWVAGALAIICFWIFEASFRLTRRLKGKLPRGEWDAQSISYGDITVTNISTTGKVALEFILYITGQGGVNLRLPTGNPT